MCFGECMWCVTSETAIDLCDCYSVLLSPADLRHPVHTVHHGDRKTYSGIDGPQYDTDCAIPVVNLFQFRKRAPSTFFHKPSRCSDRKADDGRIQPDTLGSCKDSCPLLGLSCDQVHEHTVVVTTSEISLEHTKISVR